MVSNGFFLSYEKAKELKESGLSQIQVSLDGNNATEHDTFRGFCGAYDSAISAIKNSVKAGLTVAVSCVPNKLNYNYIEKIVKKVDELGAFQFRLMPLVPMGRGSKIESLILSAEEYVRLQYRLMRLNYIEYDGLQFVEWGDPLDHYYRLPRNETIGYKSMNLEIRANGDVSVSAYLPIIVGNVREKTVKEIWESGYKDVWYSDKLKPHIEKIENIYDVSRITPTGEKKVVLPL